MLGVRCWSINGNPTGGFRDIPPIPWFILAGSMASTPPVQLRPIEKRHRQIAVGEIGWHA